MPDLGKSAGSPPAALDAAERVEGEGRGPGRPRTALTQAVKKTLEEARELQGAFVDGAKDLAIQAECDAHDKGAQKEWKTQALQETKAIEAALAKGKKFKAKAQKIPEGQDSDLDSARVSAGKRCDALEGALRVVRAETGLNTRIPFRLRFDSSRFRCGFDSESSPIRVRFDPYSNPRAIPMRARLDSVLHLEADAI